MTLQQYPVFYRRRGIRRTDQLVKPPLNRLELFDLPRNSIYHYLGTGPLDDGPTDTENALKSSTKSYTIDTVTELKRLDGNPRRLPIDVNRSIRGHRAKNPRFRPFKSLESAVRDPESMVVINYSYLHRLYKYLRNYFTSHYRWTNLLGTAFEKIGEMAAVSDRQQFIEFDLPRILPSLSQLRTAQRALDQRTARVFATSESIILLQMWEWLGVRRENSIISKIPQDRLDRVNLVFRESGRYVVINLGTLNSWRKPTKEELEKNPNLTNTGTHQAERIQKLFIRMTMSLFEARTGQVEEPIEEGDDEVTAVSSPQAQASSNNIPTTGDSEFDRNLDDDDERTPASVEFDEHPDIDDVPNIDAQIDADLETLENIGEQVEETEQPEEEVFDITTVIPQGQTLEDAIISRCNTLADAGGLSAAEYRKYLDMAGTYKSIVAPNGQTMDKFIQIPKEVLKISESPAMPDKATVTDKSMLKSSLLVFDEVYVNEVMQRDIAAMVMSLQNAGMIVQDYQIEDIEDVSMSYHSYTVKVKPLQGATSTLRFRIPKVDPDGTFKVNGVNYRTRKQRGDLPIRKIAPNRVALTSYYGKVFVNRSEKKVNDYGRWLNDAIMVIGLSDQDLITDLVPGNAFVHEIPAPKLYTTIAKNFRSFRLRIGDTYWKMSFEIKDRHLMMGDAGLKGVEEGGNILVGVSDRGSPMVMGQNGALYAVEGGPEGNTLHALAPLEDIVGLKLNKAPIEFAELKVFGKLISLGVVLGYLLGLDNLLKILRVNPRIVPAGQRPAMAADEWAITFQDEAWIFSRDDALATMVLAGWRDYEKTTLNYPAHEFNRKDVYFNVLEDSGLGVRYMRELDLLNQMFIDPITKGLLEDMKEPTEFPKLLLRGGELLINDQHPYELDPAYMRIKGYERFSGILYGELVKSARVHNARANKAIAPLELNPYAVWIAINEDPAKNQNLEINPIQNLKESEAVTFGGVGGRSGRSMVKRTRAYHRNDMGTISEATVDNSDVAVNTYLSADPQFNSLRGTSNKYEIGKTGATALFSTSALLSVGADRDDPKRTNFISIQHGHGIACGGYHQAQVRTGYEQMLGARTSDLFHVAAKQNGKVVSVNKSGIVVEYEDKTRVGVQLGRRYGKAAGLVIPHEIVTWLKAGQVFQKGDTIAYNTGFFERDVLNPKQVIWKSSVNAKTVLMESTDTLEDSSSVSRRLAEHLTTKTTTMRTIVVNFNQQIHNLVEVGAKMEYESILCLIEDAVSASNSLLDQETIDTLRVLGAQSPQSKVRGVVERIEVYYHGDKEDMSTSLRALADESDKAMVHRNEAAGKAAFNGAVDGNYRIENEPLLLDTAAIQIYITSEVPAGVGDKGVFANQMKTVFGKVFENNIRTETGVDIDAVFSASSIDNRIVLSAFMIGTTTTLLNVIAKKAVEAYRS